MRIEYDFHKGTNIQNGAFSETQVFWVIRLPGCRQVPGLDGGYRDEAFSKKDLGITQELGRCLHRIQGRQFRETRASNLGP